MNFCVDSYGDIIIIIIIITFWPAHNTRRAAAVVGTYHNNIIRTARLDILVFSNARAIT